MDQLLYQKSTPLIRELERYIFLLYVFTLPLENVTKRITISAIGKNISQYFLLLGIILYIYECFKYNCKTQKILIRFLFIFSLWQLMCLALGIIYYQYPHYLLIDKSTKIAGIYTYLLEREISVNPIFLNKVWQFLRFSKEIILTGNTTFYVVMTIMHLYENNFERAFYDIRKPILCMVVLMCSYSLVELAWLKFHLDWAKTILILINPFFYDVASSHNWWPPLLWKGQLRSIMPEPSYFGYYAIFYIPFLWSYFFEKKVKMFSPLLLLLFSLMIAATNSRPAIILTVLESVILMGITLLSWNRYFIKRSGLILIIMGIGLLINLFNPTGIKIRKQESSLGSYVNQNIISVGNKNMRSNSARLGNLIAHLYVVSDFPITGVGKGLTSAYINDRLPEFSFTNNEVRNWSRYMYQNGALKSGFPALNLYADIAASSGIPGLLLFLLPFVYMFRRLIKDKTWIRNPKCFMLVGCLITLLAAGFSNSFNGGPMGVVLGLLYIQSCSLSNSAQ